MVRTACTLRWLPRHLLMVAAATALSLLGRWQWDVSQSQRGGLQNLLYAFQWWAMAAMVIYGWWRLLHDEAHPRASAESDVETSGPAVWATTADVDDLWALRPAGPLDAQPAPGDARTIETEDDRELAEYNDYLARLSRRAERTGRSSH